MREVYPLLISFSVFISTVQNLFLMTHVTFWRTVSWLFLIHVTPLCHSFMRPAAATPLSGSGLCSCLLSTQPSVAASTPRDESLKLSNFGEIPGLLYLDITEAKGAVGQEIGGRPPRYWTQYKESLCPLLQLQAVWVSRTNFPLGLSKQETAGQRVRRSVIILICNSYFFS